MDQEPEHPELAAGVLRKFRVVFNAVKAHFREVERRSGIAGAQLWALSVIDAMPDLGINALAAAMDIHQSTASNLVRALVQRGFVRVGRDADDRRVVRLRTTAAARALLARAPGPFAGVLPQALATLDPATLSRLNVDLDKLIGAIGADDGAEGIPLGQD